MATITITIDDQLNADLITSICYNYKYSSTLPDGTPNPQTPGQFTFEKIMQWGAENVLAWKKQLAIEQAVASVVYPDTASVSYSVS